MTKQEFMAMSLPYGLKIKQRPFAEVEYYNATTYFYDNFSEEILPILYPLSDLTKEIEHKGEKFVPIEKIWSIVYNDSINSKFEYITTANSILCHSTKTGYDCHVFVDNIYDNKFWKIIKLVEWHFDIAELIEKGEAIDVNTLPENPYK